MSTTYEKQTLAHVEEFLDRYLSESGLPLVEKKLLSSMRYSLFTGGKRFRPMLAMFCARALNCAEERVLPFACSVEMVHTYSLIHDDLPCMDNDSVRRGAPTNHILYQEDTALLSGDALLTEAFCLIAKEYSHVPEIATELVSLLSAAAGMRGMISGQAIDIKMAKGQVAKNDLTLQSIIDMHALKTGALIAVAAEGAAVVARATAEQRASLKTYGIKLGLAFQVADDILDFNEKKLEPSSVPALVGVPKTRELLKQITQEAHTAIQNFGAEADMLRKLIDFNFNREI